MQVTIPEHTVMVCDICQAEASDERSITCMTCGHDICSHCFYTKGRGIVPIGSCPKCGKGISNAQKYVNEGNANKKEPNDGRT